MFIGTQKHTLNLHCTYVAIKINEKDCKLTKASDVYFMSAVKTHREFLFATMCMSRLCIADAAEKIQVWNKILSYFFWYFAHNNTVYISLQLYNAKNWWTILLTI